MVTDVSFQTKTEAIELEPRVAKPIQLGEHEAIGLPLLPVLPNQAGFFCCVTKFSK